MADIIEPRVLKGFRDFLPAAQSARLALIEKIEATFRAFGFVPIDTPALEYAEILLGKGGGETEKQIYRFKDNGGRDVALRFDLTVPFARFVAQHGSQLAFPFKRYHIGKVWRGENAQRGRFREFTQCDFDIIGSDGAAADFEILLIARSALRALGVGATIRVNHRGLFNRFLEKLGQQENLAGILRAVDKAGKAGAQETAESLAAIAGDRNARGILDFIRAPAPGESFREALSRAEDLSGGPSEESRRLALLDDFARDSGESPFALDASITRGLDYYTGMVFETFLDELPDIGSVSSGGRYDNLAGLYSKREISGVGASVGLDRLFAALEILGRASDAAPGARLGIACLNEESAGLYQALAARFRSLGLACEVFGERAEPARQFALAEKKGLLWMAIPGENPLSDPLALRNLSARKNREGLTVEEAARIVLEASGGAD